jgi:SPP1 gp7 family putative phage head morphogenesis protein
MPPEQPFQGGNTAPNNGKPTGQNPNGYKKRTTSPEQNSGNAPKAKAGYAMAYSNNLDEEYEFELLNAYETIQQNFQELVSNNDSLDKAFLFGSVIGFLASLKQINEQFIDSICQNEVTRLDANFSNSLQESKKNRILTANSYVDKLSFDIAEKLSANTTTENLVDSISQVFSSNKYRVKMMATENAFESRRTMDIGVGSEQGFTSARWVSNLDEKTCGVCAGLHGQVFKITEVPPRTHPNCRCTVEFI